VIRRRFRKVPEKMISDSIKVDGAIDALTQMILKLDVPGV
jgi:maltooligosyltrehalose synthase